jgi:hypothetical protein
MTSAVGRGGEPEETSGHEEALARARAGVAERLRARRAEIDEAIFARVSNQWFDRTGSEDPEYVAGLRAAGEAALDYALGVGASAMMRGRWAWVGAGRVRA